MNRVNAKRRQRKEHNRTYALTTRNVYPPLTLVCHSRKTIIQILRLRLKQGLRLYFLTETKIYRQIVKAKAP